MSTKQERFAAEELFLARERERAALIEDLFGNREQERAGMDKLMTDRTREKSQVDAMGAEIEAKWKELDRLFGAPDQVSYQAARNALAESEARRHSLLESFLAREAERQAVINVFVQREQQRMEIIETFAVSHR